jgi:quercetin dioxygenase-like cupin family protein
MIKQSIESVGKGWFVGPWNSAVPVAVGFSDRGLDDPHIHDEMFELYLVASGSSTAIVDGRTVALAAGDLLVVEPGEQHTFTANSDDYRHFVIQAPFVHGDKRSE